VGRSTGLLASNMEHISNDVYDFASFEAILFQAVTSVRISRKHHPLAQTALWGFSFSAHFSSPLSGLAILRYQCFSNGLAILGRGTDERHEMSSDHDGRPNVCVFCFMLHSRLRAQILLMKESETFICVYSVHSVELLAAGPVDS